MDVKIAFLYGKIEEELYVCQPPGFKDPNIPDRVYKVEKALYRLHQAPRAWYETLSTYLLDNEFQRGKIDNTLFIKMYKDEFYGRTYILFRITSEAEEVSQDKYVDEILKKFGFIDVKTASTLMDTQKPLLKDNDGEEVDVHMYRSMIGSLMYLTSSRPDIMFAVCACARYQVNPKVSHLHAVKRIFRYLKGQPKLGIWYPKDSLFDLVAYTDSDYARASLDRKSTTGGCQFLGSRLISWQCKKQTVDRGNIAKTQSKAIPNESSSLGTTSGGGPRRQETMHDTIAQTRGGSKCLNIGNGGAENLNGLKRLYKVGLTTRVKSSRDEESLGEDASKQGRINAIDADEDITLINDLDDADMFDVNTLTGDEVLAEQEVHYQFQTIDRQDLVEGSSKRAGDELEQEVTKKKKVDDVQETAEVDDDQEAAKIKELMKIIPDEEDVAIDVIPLATKPPTIVDWKIHKEGKKNYYQIIRADGSSKMYLGDLITMFEPHVEDRVWRNQQDYRVLDWKLYDSCRVHSLRMQHMYIHMLVEKRYPLTHATITDMLNKKLQCDHFSEMVYQLLKLLTKQLKINEVFGSILPVINEAFNEET
ncbi:putative ribonuclease H-like domain-containing protein [Tanacetum coccineum]|uniref:Ribonuclease H-like domain-containing protein n=1 Tax=Tanacetum coccineum TaxID=301880 RepID=A0ABQ4YMJ8_9ASTR